MLALFLKIVFRKIFRNIIFRKNKTYALFLKIKSSEVCLRSMKVKGSDLLFEFSKIKTNVIHKKSLCSNMSTDKKNFAMTGSILARFLHLYKSPMIEATRFIQCHRSMFQM